MRTDVSKAGGLKPVAMCMFLFAAIAPAKIAVAQSPAVNFTPDSAFNNVEATDIGWEFSVTTPVWVSALGYYDYSSNPSGVAVYCCSPFSTTPGLLDNHSVGIWNSSGALLTSTVVPSGTAGTLIGNSIYSPIATIELQPGEYVVGATQQGSLDANPTDPVAYLFSSFTSLPGITVLGGTYSYAGGPGVLTEPTGLYGYQSYTGPDFLASNTPPLSAPEGSSTLYFLASVLAVFLGGVVKCRIRT
jgi:hypothetical protein